ncbi:MAG: FMN-binding protein, partial [Clostridiales bacterium]|nr:FMN-binding protein [Clostridiales bacterium]
DTLQAIGGEPGEGEPGEGEPGEGEPGDSPYEGGKYYDGVFEGVGAGYNGALITLTVETEDGLIKNIAVVNRTGQSTSYWNTVDPALFNSIIAEQSVDVDAVSGATMSSNGVLTAVGLALAKANALPYIETGDYGDIDAVLWQENKDQASMMSPLMAPKATLEVEQDGKVYAYIKFQATTIAGVPVAADAVKSVTAKLIGHPEISEAATLYSETADSRVFKVRVFNTLYPTTLDIFHTGMVAEGATNVLRLKLEINHLFPPDITIDIPGEVVEPADEDYDGDGVPNGRDYFPKNPNRSYDPGMQRIRTRLNSSDPAKTLSGVAVLAQANLDGMKWNTNIKLASGDFVLSTPIAYVDAALAGYPGATLAISAAAADVSTDIIAKIPQGQTFVGGFSLSINRILGDEVDSLTNIGGEFQLTDRLITDEQASQMKDGSHYTLYWHNPQSGELEQKDFTSFQIADNKIAFFATRAGQYVFAKEPYPETAPEITFAETFGGTLADSFLSVAPTADGGFAATVSTSSIDGDMALDGVPAGAKRALVKFDSSVNVEWVSYLAASSIAKVTVLPDGAGYLVSGSFSGTIDGIAAVDGEDAYIAKFSESGELLDLKRYGSTGADCFYKVVPASSGGYIVAGFFAASDGAFEGYVHKGGWEAVVLKLDADGNVEWHSELGGTGNDIPQDIIETGDGYLLAGYSASTNGDFEGMIKQQSAFLAMFDKAGAKQWIKTYNGNGTSIVPNGNDSNILPFGGGFVFSVNTNSTDGIFAGKTIGGFENRDTFVIKIDSSGNVQWVTGVGSLGADTLGSIAVAPDGGILAVVNAARTADADFGEVFYDSAYKSRTALMKLDANGEMQYLAPFKATAADDSLSNFFVTSDGGILAVGASAGTDGIFAGLRHDSSSTDAALVKFGGALVETDRTALNALNEAAALLDEDGRDAEAWAAFTAAQAKAGAAAANAYATQKGIDAAYNELAAAFELLGEPLPTDGGDDPDPEGYVPGIYSGVGQGYDGNGSADIQVFVQTTEDEIVKIFAGAHNQTAMFFNMAFNGAYGATGIPAQVIEKQSLDGVDAVSGATLSSNGIMAAIASALDDARTGDAVAPDEAQTVPAAIWNANADQPSMMNGMLVPQAEVRRYGSLHAAEIKIGPTTIYGLSVNGADAQNIRAANAAGEFVVAPVTESYDEASQTKTLVLWLNELKTPLPMKIFVAPMSSDQTVRLKLTFGVEKDKLEAAIAAAAPKMAGAAAYTDDSFAPFAAAYEAAQAALASDEATQGEVDAAAAALTAAERALVLKPRDRVASTMAELIEYATTDAANGDVIRLGADLPAQGETISGNSRRLLAVSKSITVDGQGHALDGQGNFGFFQVTGGELVLENIVFKNARLLPEGTGQVGTAVYVTGGNLAIRNCAIVDNVAIKAQNAGIYVQGGRNIAMENCVLIGNQAKTGASLLLAAGATGIVSNSVIIGAIPSTDEGTVCRDVNFGQTNSAVEAGANNIFGTVYSNYLPAAAHESSFLGGLKAASEYAPERWAALEALIAGLKQAAVSDAANLGGALAAWGPQIRAAIAALDRQADTAALEAAIAGAKLLEAGDYTAESYAALLAAISAAEDALAGDGATQEEIDELLGALEAAIEGLEEAEDPGDGGIAQARSELLALIQNTGGVICASLFSEESATAYEAALKAAADALADDEAQAEAIEAARVALLKSVRELEVRSEYGEYAELAALLLGVAELNGGDYTPASWRALSDVVEGAWGFIEAAIGGAGEETGAGESAGEEAGAGAGESAGAGAGSYAPLADVSPAIAAWTVAVREAIAALEALPAGGSPGGGTPDAISGGVYARGGAIELTEEELGEGGGAAQAGFYVATGGASRVGTINMRLSYRLADVESAEFSLAAGLAGKATLKVLVEDEDESGNEGENEGEGEGDIVAPKPILPGYRTYSLYILANPGATLDIGEGDTLLEAALALKPIAGGEGKAVSLLLTHLDIVYHDAGGEEILAATSIAPSVASQAVRVFSRFDVNRDGAVTLVDVDTVRRLLGNAADGGEWATDTMRRCDLDGSGVIDIADLTAAIAKYESTVQ